MNDTIGVSPYIRLNEPIIVNNKLETMLKVNVRTLIYSGTQQLHEATVQEHKHPRSTQIVHRPAATPGTSRMQVKNFTTKLLTGGGCCSGLHVAKSGQYYEVRLFTGYVSDLMCLK